MKSYYKDYCKELQHKAAIGILTRVKAMAPIAA